jgi:hypothetical protein
MGHLVYTLYLLRPKRALVIVRGRRIRCQTDRASRQEFRDTCRRAGIEFWTWLIS